MGVLHFTIKHLPENQICEDLPNKIEKEACYSTGVAFDQVTQTAQAMAMAEASLAQAQKFPVNGPEFQSHYQQAVTYAVYGSAFLTNALLFGEYSQCLVQKAPVLDVARAKRPVGYKSARQTFNSCQDTAVLNTESQLKTLIEDAAAFQGQKFSIY